MGKKKVNVAWARVYSSGEKQGEEKLSNRQFAAQDKGFMAACKRAGVEPTKRQASKWRNGKGKAIWDIRMGVKHAEAA